VPYKNHLRRHSTTDPWPGTPAPIDNDTRKERKERRANQGPSLGDMILSGSVINGRRLDWQAKTSGAQGRRKHLCLPRAHGQRSSTAMGDYEAPRRAPPELKKYLASYPRSFTETSEGIVGPWKDKLRSTALGVHTGIWDTFVLGKRANKSNGQQYTQEQEGRGGRAWHTCQEAAGVL
jgi:hypothetical protein